MEFTTIVWYFSVPAFPLNSSIDIASPILSDELLSVPSILYTVWVETLALSDASAIVIALRERMSNELGQPFLIKNSIRL